jgi:hypothetical protein
MMRTRSAQLVMLSALGVALAGCTKSDEYAAKTGDTAADTSVDTVASVSAPATLGAAEYTIVVKSRWTKAEHPLEWPSSAHFSGVIGATHKPDYSIFAIGSPPTRGLERLSEEGKHTPLDNEIRAAITTGKAGTLFESGPLTDFSDSIVTSAKVDDAFPLISLVMMVAPSPDWFTGVKDIDLRQNGAWSPSKTVDLVAYDSGGDDGTTYMAPNKDTNPKKATSQAMTPHFVINGNVVPVGSVTFIRKQ